MFCLSTDWLTDRHNVIIDHQADRQYCQVNFLSNTNTDIGLPPSKKTLASESLSSGEENWTNMLLSFFLFLLSPAQTHINAGITTNTRDM